MDDEPNVRRTLEQIEGVAQDCLRKSRSAGADG
jgi:hypothetical protein